MHQRGKRKEYYESLSDVWEMFTLVASQRKRREIDPILNTLRRCRDELTPEALGGKAELDAAQRRFHRVNGRPSYDCDTCGHHIHPTAGTIYHKSSTSLHLWYAAAYMITSTRCGVSAKTLERELGVTYKTAWRMFNKIRNQLMDESDDSLLTGEVEADETMVGGKFRNADRRKRVAARTWIRSLQDAVA